jgi:hypothetical protein
MDDTKAVDAADQPGEAAMDAEGYAVWHARGSDGLVPCDAVPLPDVPLVLDRIAAQLHTVGMRINEAHGVAAVLKPGKAASLRQGTILSLSIPDEHAMPDRIWLARQYLHCDRGCEGCSVRFRLTVYSTSPSTCVIDWRGRHGTRSKPLVMRTGFTAREEVRQLYASGAIRTQGDASRFRQRKLAQAVQPKDPDAGDDRYARRTGPRRLMTRPRMVQMIAYLARKYVSAVH